MLTATNIIHIGVGVVNLFLCFSKKMGICTIFSNTAEFFYAKIKKNYTRLKVTIAIQALKSENLYCPRNTQFPPRLSLLRL